jgi:hypothetical protein
MELSGSGTTYSSGPRGRIRKDLGLDPASEELEDIGVMEGISVDFRNGSWPVTDGCADGVADAALASACLAIVLAAAVARACLSISETLMELFNDWSAILELGRLVSETGGLLA